MTGLPRRGMQSSALGWPARVARLPSLMDRSQPLRTNQLVLVTFNTADYADFVSLTVEDWRA